MITTAQQFKAQTFLSLHDGSRLLVLPNIWNPIGARLLAAKGYPAIATASAAVSASLGYADGEKINLETLLDLLVRITKSADLPVTADIESGYADSIEPLKETIRKIIDAGVVGINLEDGLVEGGSLRTVDEQCARIAAVRETAAQIGLHLVINARVDSFLTGDLKSQEERIEDAVARAKRYKDAGADCIYPIGPGDRQRKFSLCAFRIAGVAMNKKQQVRFTGIIVFPYPRAMFVKFDFRFCHRWRLDFALRPNIALYERNAITFMLSMAIKIF